MKPDGTVVFYTPSNGAGSALDMRSGDPSTWSDADQAKFNDFIEKAGDEILEGLRDFFDYNPNLLDDALPDILDGFLEDILDRISDGNAEGSNQAAGTQDTPESTADWIQSVWDVFWNAWDMLSPLTLDLDADGVELVALADTTVYWDIDQDGYAEASGWVAPDDGLLAIDLDDDGAISSHSELFGDSVYADGFSALAVYDTNVDGVIDANDAQFGDLIVWQDVNQNGISEADEMHLLADFNITSINLNATSVSQTNAGHDVRLVSTFTMDDGVTGPQTLDIVDVWFQYDNANSEFIDSYKIDVRSLFVDTLRGYGNLADLHIAASLDNEVGNSGSLLNLLDAFASKEYTTFFADDGSVLSEVRDIMFRWAGVDTVEPTSRGDFVDARELGFIEKLVDQVFHDGYDPAGLQGEELSHAFNMALQAISARLVAQSEGAQLFEGDFYYNPAADTFEGITGINQTGLDTLLAKAQDASQVGDKVAYWGDVVRVVDQIIGVANLSAGDATALETAIVTSDDTLTTQLILDTLEWNSAEGSTILGTTSADTLGGIIGDDTIYGGYGNDIVMGGIGADTLRGQGHDDTLNGQSGDDLLFGETGNDTYLYFAGQGHDSITEQSGSDRVLFGPGVTSADLTFTRISNDALQIDVAHSAGGGAVTIENQFTAAQVEMLKFDDGSTLDLSTVSHTLEGTAGADTLKGIRYGGSQEDTIYGLGGDDMIYGYNAVLDYAQNWLYGGDGNDTIYGSYGVDYIEGGADNDYIRGYNGDDELHGGFGDDEILGGNQNDTLYGDAGADILKGENNNDILIGGLGADELWSGTGYDTFTFLNGQSLDAVDTIKDFNSIYDAIDISDLLSAYDPLADAITDFVQITDNGTDSTLSVDLDGGADNFTAIALIAGKTGLTDEEALETSGTLIAA
ncbi:MAG: type I secretion C-terminal target domain-containing protein [Candidatus Thiodiazotropha sp.]